MSDQSTVTKPYIPKRGRWKKADKVTKDEPATFLALAADIFRTGIPQLPSMFLKFMIPVAIVTVVNYILMTIPTYSVYGTPKTILFIMVFITASYNGVVQRTIFWGIMLTIGRKLFYRIRQDGLKQLQRDAAGFIPEMKKTAAGLGKAFPAIMIGGAGIGFVFGNYLTRNNRIDKQSVSIVVALTIIGALSKQGRSLLVLAVKLLLQDISRLIGKSVSTESPTKMLLAGTAAGLLGNLIFAFIKIDRGGYNLGGFLIVAGIVLSVLAVKGGKANEGSEDL